MDIGSEIAKGIKEGKWIDINYHNKNGENTQFWVAIKDIEPIKRKLTVSIFNISKSLNCLETVISYDSIVSASVLDLTTYDINDKLIDKIENNLNAYSWLNYDKFSNNILNYYKECVELDCDPVQTNYSLVDGVDYKKLLDNKSYNLNENQIKQISFLIKHLKEVDNSSFTLALNECSIDRDIYKYPITYYNVKFDPLKKTLVLENLRHFYFTFVNNGVKHSLSNYIDVDVDEFIKNFSNNKVEYLGIINDNLLDYEILNTRPELILFKREFKVRVEETYKMIQTKYENNSLPIPLKSFFGNISKRNNIRRKEPTLIVLDKKININQMRVLYNAMKYPVTYVQGPPGTGKTQTILNVALSSFYNGRTVLICSSNNKPVDGIIEKLNFKYRNKTIQFPFLRLGNEEMIKEATLKIRSCFELDTKDEPILDKLNKIKENNDSNNETLIEILNRQEKRVELETYLASSRKLLSHFHNVDNPVTRRIKKEAIQFEEELKQYHEITNEEIMNLFTPVEGSNKLSQYLYFLSLDYILKLKKYKSRYQELKDICYIEDDKTRIKQFNK